MRDEDLAIRGDTGSIARCSLSMSTPTTTRSWSWCHHDHERVVVGVGEGRETFVFEYICLPHHDARVVVVILFDQDLVLLGHVSEKRYVALQSSAT